MSIGFIDPYKFVSVPAGLIIPWNMGAFPGGAPSGWSLYNPTSNEIINNFASWTEILLDPSMPAWAYTGVWTHIAGRVKQLTSDLIQSTPDVFYTLVVDVTHAGTGGLTVVFGGTTFSQITASGAYTYTLTASQATPITFFASSGWIGSINSASLTSTLRNRFPVGAGSTYALNNSGSGGRVTFWTPNENTSAQGAHYGTLRPIQTGANSPSADRWYFNGTTDGEHQHLIIATPYMAYSQFQFIKALIPMDSFPSNSILLSTLHTSISWLTNIYDGGTFLKSSNVIGNAVMGQSLSIKTDVTTTDIDFGNNGQHEHNWDTASAAPAGGNPTTRIFPWPGPSAFDGYAGEHTHNFASVILTQNIKKTYATAWTKASASFQGFNGMIGMWDGSPTALPNGWVLCNGTNGTLDLRNYFINIGNSSNIGTQTGNNTISFNPDIGQNILANDLFSHQHYQVEWIDSAASTGRWLVHEAGDSFPHHHAGTVGNNLAYLPPYFALYFIQKA